MTKDLLTRRNFLKYSGLGVAASALLLAGCASDDETAVTDSGKASGADTLDDASKANPIAGDVASVSEIDTSESDGKTSAFVVGGVNDMGSLAPSASGSDGISIVGYIYEHLFWKTENGELVGELAESWAKLDDYNYTITIYDNIYDSDGNHMTSSDIKWMIEYQTLTLGNTGAVPSLDHVEIVDDYTIKYVIKKPFPTGQMNQEFSNFVYVTQAAFEASEDGFASTGVGTGTYLCEKYTPGSGLVLQSRGSDYWQKDESKKWLHQSQNIETLYLDFIPDASQRAIALQTGEVDYAPSIATMDLQNFTDTDKYQTVHILSFSTCWLLFNCGDGSPCKDINLRKAILYAINADDIVDAMDVKADRAYACCPKALNAPESWDVKKDYWDQDIELAQKYLAESTYNNEELVILSRSSQTGAESTCLVMKSQLSKVGINAKPNVLDKAMYNTVKYEKDTWDMQIGSFSNGYYLGMQVQNLSSVGYESVLNGNNISMIHDDKLNELVENVRYDGTDEDAQALEDYINENVYLCALYNPYSATVMKTGFAPVFADSGNVLCPPAFVFSSDFKSARA